MSLNKTKVSVFFRDASAIWFEKLFVLFCFLYQQKGLEEESEVAKSALEDLGVFSHAVLSKL
jgi:hypothetical protein